MTIDRDTSGGVARGGALTEATDMPAAPQQVKPETLTRWSDDGGAVPPADTDNDAPDGVAASPQREATEPEAPDLSNAELVQLRVRVIAIEAMLVALLADVSEGQLNKVRAMADRIKPREGQTPHPLTTSASAQMLALLHRAATWDSGTNA